MSVRHSPRACAARAGRRSGQGKQRLPGLLVAGLLSLIVGAFSTGGLLAQTGTDPPADGQAVFQRWCSTCHGDRGQGLTPEWRSTWPDDHQNCSWPQCHGRDHPPGAAHIPDNTVPAVIGPDTLNRFARLEELYEYLHSQMPGGWPGHLSDEEYWALTTFLLAHDAQQASADPPGRLFLNPDWPAWKRQRLEGWR